MEGFLAIAVISFLGAVSPGPDFILIVKNSLAYNRRVGFFSALGVGSGVMVHVTYTLLGIGFLISKSILLYSIIKYLGAAYLIYIGIKSIFSKSGKNDLSYEKKSNTISDSLAFKQGFLTNALNPKATVFFVSIFSQVITAETAMIVRWAYGFEMALIIGFWFVCLSQVLGNQFVRGRFTSVQVYVDKVMGTLLILLGLKIAVSSNK